MTALGVIQLKAFLRFILWSAIIAMLIFAIFIWRGRGKSDTAKGTSEKQEFIGAIGTTYAQWVNPPDGQMLVTLNEGVTVLCISDNWIGPNDYVIPSQEFPGECHDTGIKAPKSSGGPK